MSTDESRGLHWALGRSGAKRFGSLRGTGKPEKSQPARGRKTGRVCCLRGQLKEEHPGLTRVLWLRGQWGEAQEVAADSAVWVPLETLRGAVAWSSGGEGLPQGALVAEMGRSRPILPGVLFAEPLPGSASPEVMCLLTIGPNTMGPTLRKPEFRPA